jgi:hypothetical protein
MTQSIATNAKNDIFVGQNGNLAFVSGLQAAVQNCQTAMLALQGEALYAVQSGMPYPVVAWNNYRQNLFAAAARSVIMAVQDVTAVLAFSSSMAGNVLNYKTTIQTVFGNVTFSNI